MNSHVREQAMIRHPMINNNIVYGLNQLILEKGIRPSTLYHEVNLSTESMTTEGKLIPFHQEVKLLDLAASKLNMQTLGLELARRQDIRCLGPISAQIPHQNSVMEALTNLQENIHQYFQGITLSLSISHSNAFIELNSQYPEIFLSQGFQDHALALVYMMMQALCGNDWRPRAVYLCHPEMGFLSDYCQYFNAPIAFDSDKLAISFDPKVLMKSIAQETKALYLPQETPLYNRQNQDLIQQIKYIISHSLSQDNCNVETVASSLGQSKRTIQRRLKANNTSFQALVDSVRSNQAIPYLKNPYYSLSGVASILGYSQLSAFSRSFKRWFDVSPQEWRRQNFNHANRKIPSTSHIENQHSIAELSR